MRLASAEDLPFGDDTFDAVVAQLVVHFMTDPVAGLREMARVARSGGAVAACVWDFAGAQAPLSIFWAAVRELDPQATDESNLAGAREGHLGELFRLAGLHNIEERLLPIEAEHRTFEEWWEPFTLGVGPAGAYVKGPTPIVERGCANGAGRRSGPLRSSSPRARGRRAVAPSEPSRPGSPASWIHR